MILLSPSQIKTYRECVRKWGLTKIALLKTPSTKSQALGKDVDDNQLQPYLKEGKPFDFTRVTEGYEAHPGISAEIATSGLHFLPQPKWQGLEVQKHFVFQSPSKMGFGYQGYKDVWLPFGGAPGVQVDGPVIIDFKTTKSIKKWALTAETLGSDVQAVIYAVNAILETKSKHVTLDWIYMQTEGTRLAKPSIVTVSTNDVADQFAEIEKTAKEMYLLARNGPHPGSATAQDYAMTLPPNPAACDSYGGCPFRHICNLSPEELVASIDKPAYVPKSEQGERIVPEIDLFAKLGKKAQTTAPVVAEQETPSASTVPEVVPMGINPPMPEGVPEAPPVGSVEAKPKRGRPKGSTKKPDAHAAVAEAETVAEPCEGEDINVACLEFAVALKKFLKAVR